MTLLCLYFIPRSLCQFVNLCCHPLTFPEPPNIQLPRQNDNGGGGIYIYRKCVLISVDYSIMNFASPPSNYCSTNYSYICWLFSYLDKTLANVLTPGEKLCGKKFELRIDDILFIGHPTLVSHRSFNQVERKT